MPTEIDPPGVVASLAAARAAREIPSEDWMIGWRAGREALDGELAAAYRRGLRARPATGTPLWLPILAGFVFIVGFVLGAWTTL